MTKVCTKCGVEKGLDDYHKDKSHKDGRRTVCKVCRSGTSKYSKEHYEKNKERINKRKKEHYEKNKEVILEKAKEYYKENKEEINKRNINYKKNNISKIRVVDVKRKRERYNTEPIYKLKSIIRKSINESLRGRGYTKKSRTHTILDCSFEEFKKYLESQWEDWMNWNNHGMCNGEFNYGWDIDHIIPISEAETEEDVIRLNHYTNLQPLCSHINRNIKRDLRV
tara:strand:+ start:145 stop:816 length:672 start_codon:yes stop_codon:yes gene_type:complete